MPDETGEAECNWPRDEYRDTDTQHRTETSSNELVPELVPNRSDPSPSTLARQRYDRLPKQSQSPHQYLD